MIKIAFLGLTLLGFAGSVPATAWAQTTLETHGTMTVTATAESPDARSEWNSLRAGGEIYVFFDGDPRGVLTFREDATGEELNFKLNNFENGDLVVRLNAWPGNMGFLSFGNGNTLTVEVNGKADGLWFENGFREKMPPQFDGAGQAVLSGIFHVGF